MDQDLLKLQARMYAEVARMEGYKADNQARVHRGEYAVYGEEDFNLIAFELEKLCHEMANV